MMNRRNSIKVDVVFGMRSGFDGSQGFALLAVIGVMAIIMALTLSVAHINLRTVRAPTWESRNQRAEYLLDSGLRYAALSIASPRIYVSTNAVPKQNLVYPNPVAPVRLAIENEAGRIDLVHAEPELLESALRSAGAAENDLNRIKESLDALAFGEKEASLPTKPKVRDVWMSLRDLPLDGEALWDVVTIGGTEAGVNAELASATVLALIPGLSSAQQQQILSRRDSAENQKYTESLIGLNRLLGKQFENKHFVDTVSSHYRIKAEVVIAGQRYSKTWIVKMLNQASKLFEITAEWQG
jgi:type II secretory pathway component PulK